METWTQMLHRWESCGIPIPDYMVKAAREEQEEEAKAQVCRLEAERAVVNFSPVYVDTEGGAVKFSTGELVSAPVPSYEVFYRCGDTGKIKRVGLYQYVRPPGPGELTQTQERLYSLASRKNPPVLGFEPVDADFLEWWLDDPSDRVTSSSGLDENRFRQSLSRARGMVQQYADCNNWSYFVTLTLDRQKQDRQDLSKFISKFKKLLENVQRATGEKPQYVMVPELHRDNVSWHFHGLMNIPESELVEIMDVYRVKRNGHWQWHMQDGYPIGYDVARKFLMALDTSTGKLTGGARLFSWRRYERNFGFCTVEAVRSQRASASYCSKMFRYISETLDDGIDRKTGRVKSKKHKAAWKLLGKGKHLYYCSRGLQKYEKMSPQEWANILAGPGLEFGKLYEYPLCEIQFYYIRGADGCQEEIGADGKEMTHTDDLGEN